MRDTLGEFEQMVLLAIPHLGQDLYGARSSRKSRGAPVANRSGRGVRHASPSGEKGHFDPVVNAPLEVQRCGEVAAITDRVRASSPHTHQHLRLRVLAYGREAPGDRAWIVELVVRHGSILLVLFVLCMNVAMLTYERAASRESEIALRCGLDANRMRIITQLFMEALVPAGVSAVIGVAAAHCAVT